MVEDLKITNMVRNHRLAQKILDASWSKFLQMLSYNEGAGRRVVRVSQRGTSQENEEKIKDRDYRAAVNILNRGLSGLGRPLAPVEERPLLLVTAEAVIEGQVSSMKQEAPCESVG